MKKKVVKIKKEYYKAMKQMTDKQIAEFVKGICDNVYEGKPLTTKDKYLKGIFMYVQRDLDEAAQNSINGKKGADKLAAMKRKGIMHGIDIVVITEQKGGNKVG